VASAVFVLYHQLIGSWIAIDCTKRSELCKDCEPRNPFSAAKELSFAGGVGLTAPFAPRTAAIRGGFLAGDWVIFR
jgi:hypothetical protein